MMAFLISCADPEVDFQKQLAEDAEAFTELKCEMMVKLKALQADTTIIKKEHVADSLKAAWKEISAPILKKYDTEDHKDQFKAKVKELQSQIEGCELENTGEKKGKRKKK